MVDLSFIKKRKAKKIVAIAGGACAGTVAILVAVALLGQRAAPLTVKLSNSGASLALYKSEFDNEHKSFLLAAEAKPYSETTESMLTEKYDKENVLDIDDSKSIKTSDGNAYQFYQYTFYLTNTGSNAADYTLALNISYPHKSSFDLADVLRVRFYENDGADKASHNYRTFAKHSDVYDPDKGEYEPEHISDSASDYAENFENASTVLNHKVSSFMPNATTRYTIVMWIEGQDKQATGEAPLDSSIALGVNISAHEAEETSTE